MLEINRRILIEWFIILRIWSLNIFKHIQQSLTFLLYILGALTCEVQQGRFRRSRADRQHNSLIRLPGTLSPEGIYRFMPEA